MFDLQNVDSVSPNSGLDLWRASGDFMDKAVNETEIDESTLLKVLENQTVLGAVRDHLRDKGLPSSASSWEQMLEKRIKPALANGSILRDDLVELIRASEEHGNKHVRLFRYADDSLADLAPAFDCAKVKEWGRANRYPVSGDYVFASYPAAPTVTEVRVGDGEDEAAFILKIARTENRRKKAELKEIDGEIFYVAAKVAYRAVDVVKIHADGLIEVRMDPRAEPPICYKGSAAAAIKFLEGLVNRAHIRELSLANAKATFSGLKSVGEAEEEVEEEVDNVSQKFELYEASHKNGLGDRVHSSSLVEKGGMTASTVMPKVIEVFTVGEHDPYCERVRVSYNHEGVKKINAILSDDINEIIFTAKLTRVEHESVLEAILAVNEKSE